ncbi:polymer-forming cytoskeletal protein [Microbacterium sp. SLBN-146]|uniref:polymer-forming cytoskeletal protein n=1 Tax=Microbacterium sp. SLBN-146 TaxID=2768457 RepID=UPI0011535209|nr:polymer-forming cytoskeletal protein [Microbacterium sp. SLBN-146]TQJ30730.1 hypothetical protein FBY39_1187 [Microbacterium sp. SLBN-146]
MSALPHVHRSLAVILATGILTLGAGSAAFAATEVPHADVTATVQDGEGPQFYTGAFVDVSGDVDGDVYAAGQSVTVSGDVTGDVIAAAQTITITGTVEGNVRLAAQDVTITGDISRSGTIFAATVTVGDAGSIESDLVAAAGRIRIAGDIGRDMFVSVDRLSIDGTVGGDLTYTSDNDARIADGAVDGTVERIEPPQAPRTEVSPAAVFVGWLLGAIYALVALSLLTLFAGLLFPRWLDRVTDHLVPSPWKALLVGFIAAIAVPPALFVLGITIVGAPLALAGVVVWTVMVLATFVFSAHYLGRLVLRGTQHPVVRSLVGGVILIVALQIPWLNILVWLAMVFFGLGAQLLEIHRLRPWRVSRAVEPRPRTEDAASPPATESAAPASATS